MTLPDYLSHAARRPFEYGRFDCLLYLADWVKARHGFDPAAQWRGRYDTAEAAQSLIETYDGLYGLVAAGLEGHIDPRQGPARPGDIAIVMPGRGHVPCGAILGGIGWAVLNRTGGLWFGPHKPLKIWAVA